MTELDGTRIVCALESAEAVAARVADWRGVVGRATGREALEDGVALTFDHDIALTAELARLAAAEYACCSFFRFTLGLDSTGVRLAVSAPPAGRDALVAVFGPAE